MLDIRFKDQFPSGFGRQPWLIKIHEEKEKACTFINPINGTMEERHMPEMQGRKCFGCLGEWVFLVDELTRECFFLSLISYSKIHLPPFRETLDEWIGKFSLTLSPTSPDCITTFAPFGSKFILLCRRHDKEWTKLPIALCFGGEVVSSSGVNIIYKGRLFILSFQRAAWVFDVAALVDGHVKDTKSYPYHSYPLTLKQDQYLVESCKGLFLVGVHLFDEAQHVTHIEVYQLFEPSEEDDQNEDGIFWDYVSSIGDQAFFLSRMHGISLCAKEFGVEPNCIYLTVPCADGERLYKYCLDDQTFSFNVVLPGDIFNFESQLFWTIPASGMQDTEFKTEPPDFVELRKDIAMSDENQERNQISRPWTDLPTELVDLLFQRLSLVDCVRVSTVCKRWALTSPYIPEENAWPWLMHSPNISNGICKFFDPVCGKEYTLEIEALSANEQLVFHCSINGWVVVSEGDDAVFVINPLTEEVIDLPALHAYDYHCISFTGMPTAPDFRAFAFYFQCDDELVTIYSWRPGQDEWMETTPSIDTLFSGTINNPVLFDGEFYCLDRRGQLGVFNPDSMAWRVISKPEPIYLEVPHHAHACCTLLEVQGDLVSVFRTDNADAIQIYKLDRSKMAWSKLENLGDITLFVGLRNSLAVPSPLKSCRNGIYLPKFDSRDHTNGVFYSMDDHRYHPRFYGVEEPTTYVWFQPNISIESKK